MRVGLARLGTSVKLWSTCYDIILFTLIKSAYQERVTLEFSATNV